MHTQGTRHRSTAAGVAELPAAEETKANAEKTEARAVVETRPRLLKRPRPRAVEESQAKAVVEAEDNAAEEAQGQGLFAEAEANAAEQAKSKAAGQHPWTQPLQQPLGLEPRPQPWLKPLYLLCLTTQHTLFLLCPQHQHTHLSLCPINTAHTSLCTYGQAGKAVLPTLLPQNPDATVLCNSPCCLGRGTHLMTLMMCSLALTSSG